MRSILNLIFLSAIGQARFPTLEDVFGPITNTTSASPTPIHERSPDRAQRPDIYYSSRTAQNCTFPLDVVIVQDVTRSFEDDLPNMAAVQLPLMANALATSHPGSRFGLVTFRDKPIWSLGEPRTDYCQKFDQPLDSDIEKIREAYRNVQALGGGDPAENQFGAMIAACLSKTIGWSSDPDVTKLMVVVTDAPPHFEGDGFNAYGMSPFNLAFDENKADEQCRQNYYPQPWQVESQLKSQAIYLGVLVYDSQYNDFLPRDAWQWFVNYVTYPYAMLQDISYSSDNFWEQLEHVISEIEQVECSIPSTPEPSTKPPATSDATTEAAKTSHAETTPAVTETPLTSNTESHTSLPPSCGVCPNPCPPEGCDPCCADGVLIKLRHRPAFLHLEIENPPSALE